MTVNVLLIGNDAYFRTVIGHELRTEGLEAQTVGGAASAVATIEGDVFDVTVIAFPAVDYDTAELINMLRLLRPTLPIALYTEERDFLELTNRFPEIPILDSHLSVRLLAEQLQRLANGEEPAPRSTPDSRVEALLEQRARAERSQALASGLKRQYDNIVQEPLPDSLKGKLQKLFDTA